MSQYMCIFSVENESKVFSLRILKAFGMLQCREGGPCLNRQCRGFAAEAGAQSASSSASTRSVSLHGSCIIGITIKKSVCVCVCGCTRAPRHAR